ncbi:MAG TPA: flagellar hook capping FlgD N-terminal domain-containing protein [Candidatus Paceibacterota bacterium]|nr:flagellar hook capping FlgD N-terminal domain-containing protein [Candidatus Paceibacterota bacterium]
MDAVIGTGSATSSAAYAASRIPQKTLGQDDFLKLLVAQMSNQDPMSPKNDTDFIAQMAQFSALEQSKSIQTDMSRLQATSLLGQQVELIQTDEEGEQTLIRGMVTAVQMEAGKPKIVVDGQSYELTTLQTVNLIQPQT